MFSMKILLFLASVLFIADGEETLLSQPCPSEWYFCVHAKNAYRRNQEAREYLELLQRTWGKPPNSTIRVSQAEEAILESLKETNPDKITQLMIKALTAECGALVWTKVDCFTDKTPRDQRHRDMPCRGVYRKVSDAITSLVWAIEKIHPDSAKKAKVEKIFEDFINSEIPDQFDVPRYAYDMGQKVLKALKAK